MGAWVGRKRRGRCECDETLVGGCSWAPTGGARGSRLGAAELTVAESEPHPDAARRWPGRGIGGRGYAAGMVVQKVWEVEPKGDDAPSVVRRGCVGLSRESFLAWFGAEADGLVGRMIR